MSEGSPTYDGRAVLEPQRSADRTPRSALSPREWLVRCAPWLLALAVYAIAAIAVTWPVAADPTGEVFGAPGDATGNITLIRYRNELGVGPLSNALTTEENAPFGVTLPGATSLPQVAIEGPMQVVALITGSAVFAFNLAVLLGVILSAFACFLLCWHITANPWAAGVAGVGYGFNPWILERAAGHVHFTHLWSLCLVVLGLILIREGRGKWAWALFAAATVFGLYTNTYFALFIGVILAAFIIADVGAALVRRGEGRLRAGDHPGRHRGGRLPGRAHPAGDRLGGGALEDRRAARGDPLPQRQLRLRRTLVGVDRPQRVQPPLQGMDRSVPPGAPALQQHRRDQHLPRPDRHRPRPPGRGDRLAGAPAADRPRLDRGLRRRAGDRRVHHLPAEPRAGAGARHPDAVGGALPRGRAVAGVRASVRRRGDRRRDARGVRRRVADESRATGHLAGRGGRARGADRRRPRRAALALLGTPAPIYQILAKQGDHAPRVEYPLVAPTSDGTSPTSSSPRARSTR